LTIEELTTNVKELIAQAFSASTLNCGKDDSDEIPILVGKSIKMSFEGQDGAVKTSCLGHVISTGYI